ncbi:hypothetical protein B0H63DRAFT_390389, partial [Podospora didyma]
ADGTRGKPCCATRRCNIFCCSCGGHVLGCCSQPVLTTLFNAWQPDEVNAFRLVDVEGKGNVTVIDYLSYMNVEGEPGIWVEWFRKHDANGDGVITVDELCAE